MNKSTTPGANGVKATSQTEHTKCPRADLGWDTAPCIRLWDEHNNEYRHTLTPTETAAMVRRLAGYLQQLLEPAA